MVFILATRALAARHPRLLGILLAVLVTLVVFLALGRSDAAPRCAVVGDSIAEDLRRFLPECEWDARVGIPSYLIISRVRAADLLIISAGSNDDSPERLARNLAAMRARAAQLGVRRVAWILPYDFAWAREAVRRASYVRGDALLAFQAGRDGVHPTTPEYRRMAGEVRAMLTVP